MYSVVLTCLVAEVKEGLCCAPHLLLSAARPLRAGGGQPVLQVRDAALHLAHIEVRVTGEVLTDGRVSVAQGTVEGGPSDADHHGDKAQQEEKQA